MAKRSIKSTLTDTVGDFLEGFRVGLSTPQSLSKSWYKEAGQEISNKAKDKGPGKLSVKFNGKTYRRYRYQ